MEGCETCFLKNPDVVPTKGIRSYRAIALTSVVSKWCASCVLSRLKKEKRDREVEELAHGWRERDTSAFIDDEFIAKNTGNGTKKGTP